MKKHTRTIGLAILFISVFYLLHILSDLNYPYLGTFGDVICCIFGFVIAPIYYIMFGVIFKLPKKYYIFTFVFNIIYTLFKYSMKGLESIIDIICTGVPNEDFVPLMIELFISNFILFIGAGIMCCSGDED